MWWQQQMFAVEGRDRKSTGKGGACARGVPFTDGVIDVTVQWYIG